MQSARRAATAATNVAMRRAHRPDYQLILYVGLLMLLGLVIMYAIGPQRARVLNDAQGADFSATYFVIKQTVSLGLALVALAIMTFVPLHVIRQNAGRLLVAGLVASAVLFVFGNLLHVEQIAQCTLGACRWFELGPLGSFQPAELLKFGVLVFMARFLAERVQRGEVNSWEESIQPMLLLIALVSFIVIVIQKDMGTGIAMLAIVASMMMVAGVNRTIGWKLIGLLVALGVALIITAPHRIERVMTFMQGDNISTEAASGDGYHVLHAKIAIGSGGLFGVGIGNSVQATGYLPEVINDSVFAILGETFGFVGLAVLIVLFSALLLRLLRITDRLEDPWLQLLVAGVFGWLTAHIVLNIASMLGVFPLTGITLPLLSFGGTSMIFITAAIGIAFQASRYTLHSRPMERSAYANYRSGRGLGRPRHASRRSTR